MKRDDATSPRILLTRAETQAAILARLEGLKRTDSDDYELRLVSRFEVEAVLAALRSTASETRALEQMPTDAQVKAICDWMAWPYGDKSMRADASDLYHAIAKASRSATRAFDGPELERELVAERERADDKHGEVEDTIRTDCALAIETFCLPRGLEAHEPHLQHLMQDILDRAFRAPPSATRESVLMEAIVACNGERLDDPHGTDGDTGYTTAINHCISAIIKLRDDIGEKR